MFNYVCLGTNDIARATTFYDATLAPLGLMRCQTGDDGWHDCVGWGHYSADTGMELALWLNIPFDKQPATHGNGTMIALTANSWQAVRAFHDNAVQNGGTSEGKPGLRPHYQPDFYAAYVRDPDGNKLVAVCRGFTSEP